MYKEILRGTTKEPTVELTIEEEVVEEWNALKNSRDMCRKEIKVYSLDNDMTWDYT